MEREREILTLFLLILSAILVIFCIIIVGWSAYATWKYGSLPIEEIPSWALKFILGGIN